MSFTVPAANAWPINTHYGLAALGHIRGGTSTESGPSGVLLADRWVRAHALRTIYGDGREHATSSVSYVILAQTAGYISEEGIGVDAILDRIATVGVTSVRISITYAGSGLTDQNIISTTTAVRELTKTALVLPNYASGRISITVEVLNTNKYDGVYYGLALQEQSLTAL